MMRTDEIQIRDPFIVPHEDKYYLFGSTDPDIWHSPGIGFAAYESHDLEKWRGPIQAFCPDASFWGKKNFWAPEVYMHDGYWYMFATFKNDQSCRGTSILRADSVTGPYYAWSDGAVTPAAWECLDGTLYVDESGVPWMVFCHEWVQVQDGEICAVQLSSDLKKAAANPVSLFSASEASWTAHIGHEDRHGFVTDGPFIHKAADGSLHMLWSSHGTAGYCIGIAHSQSGKITGPWIQDKQPLFKRDGGHGMIFKTFDGRLLLTIHQPNRTPEERCRFFPVKEADHTLKLIEPWESDFQQTSSSKNEIFNREQINRQSLVCRHNPVNTRIEDEAFSAGNGSFAFTADITGLQSLKIKNEDKSYPLCTMSQWSWNTKSDPTIEAKKINPTFYETYGRKVGYLAQANGQDEIYNWLRENPHRFNLAHIGWREKVKTAIEGKSDKTSDAIPLYLHGALTLDKIGNIRQELDLWSGIIHSFFTYEKQPLYARTWVDVDNDSIFYTLSGISIPEDLYLAFDFSYSSPDISGADWHQPDKHKTKYHILDNDSILIKRRLDTLSYEIEINYAPGCQVIIDPQQPHRLAFVPARGKSFFFFKCTFNHNKNETDKLQKKSSQTGIHGHIRKKGKKSKLIDWQQLLREHSEKWQKFWTRGAAVQLVYSPNPQALELERRIILSQYLTAIQCSGAVPPAETGLTCNSWYGKFHLEMHYWHAAHFATWGRFDLLENSIGWYLDILPQARKIASDQGYRGARWPKMCAPDGKQSPSWIAVFLIWQQPHPLMLLELLRPWKKDPKKFLYQHLDLIIQTADFMVSYAHYDRRRDRYVLGPPIIPAQEVHEPQSTYNPAYELSYWRWALNTVNKWLKMMGKAENQEYAEVAAKLSSLPVKEDLYLAAESCPDTFNDQKYISDHPTMLAPLGVLPGDDVDMNIMENTLEKVLLTWNWSSAWGWDFPMTAMTMIRLGRIDEALKMLLADYGKNTYKTNGHNAQDKRSDLQLYLPGNGAMLLAISLLARIAGSQEYSYYKHLPAEVCKIGTSKIIAVGDWLIQTDGFCEAGLDL